MTVERQTVPVNSPRVFPGEGEMTRLMEAFPWERTPMGRPETRPKSLRAVARAVEMASPLFESRAQRLAFDVPASGLEVDGDPARLAQALGNLLTNAAKYSDSRGSISVFAGQEGTDAVVTVKDDGIGISSEMLPHVFDLFVQERQALDRSVGGLGLGLAIVRNIMKVHGGSVEASSAGIGLGSEFSLRMPLATRAAVGEGPASHPSLAPDRLVTAYPCSSSMTIRTPPSCLPLRSVCRASTFARQGMRQKP